MIKKLDDNLSSNLRLLRGHMSQMEWAQSLKVHYMTVSKWECKRRWPKEATLKKIASMNGIEPADLFRPDLFVGGKLNREPLTMSPALMEAHQIIEGHPELAELVKRLYDFKSQADSDPLEDCVRGYLNLSPDQRAAVLAVVKALLAT